MNKLETGKVYTAIRQRSGTNSGGNWELLATQDERGSNDITVFVANIPSQVPEGGRFRIEKIHSVSFGNKKDSTGSWRTAISINAEVCPVMTYAEFSQGQALEEEGVLPF